MSSRNLNGGIAGGDLVRCSADEEVAACDALPPRLRALIKGSFVNTLASTVLAQWRDLERQGVPLAAYADWFAGRLVVNQMKSCRATYGADHPQARPPLVLVQPAARPEDSAAKARAARRAAEIGLDEV
jgi:hypothetical protein